jgi:predicted nucleic acid-binding protein
MTSLVADASVVVKAILAEPGSAEAVRIIADAHPLYAPEILYAECAGAIWKRVHRGLMSAEHVEVPLADLMTVPLRPVRLRVLTHWALHLALELDHPVYDCYYLAAAIRNDCPLATADARLYDLAQRIGFGERAILVR